MWGVILLLLVCPLEYAQGQFMYLSMEVETEMSTSTIQDLDFGTYNPAEKLARVELGSPRMGIFMIRGMEYQDLILKLDTPEYLTHENPAVEDRIPIELHAAYNNNSENESRRAHPIQGEQAHFTMFTQPGQNLYGVQDLSRDWAQTYVYIYGSIGIEDAQTGVYSGTVTLTIEY